MFFIENTLFYIDDKPINRPRKYILLVPSNWDDYGNKTTFHAYLYDSTYMLEDIGEVKIAFLGEMKVHGFDFSQFYTKNHLPQSFDKLDESFCSLWQSAETYSKVRKIEKEHHLNIFKSLNDIVTQIKKIDELLNNNVVSSSLFRFVSRFECVNHFYRIYKGKTPLIDFNFKFTYEKVEENSDNSIDFKINVKSLPPTNIHALIGSNGCGKTYTIKNIVRNFINTSEIDREIESLFLISFNPFDSYQQIVDDSTNMDTHNHSKKAFNYIGIRSIEDFNHNKNVNEMADQFLESYEACLNDPRKAEALNSFIFDMVHRFSNVKEIENLMIPDTFSEDEFELYRDEVKSTFESLSAGYKEVVSIVVGTIGFMAEQSLVVMDEPENHLHPPLLSMLIRWLSKILVSRNAFAIIATHSPIILQEIPKSCVWIIERNGDIRKIRKPSSETFGANLSSLTYEVFRYEIDKSGFNCLLKDVAEKANSYEDALAKFNGCLGEEAKSRLRLFCYDEEK